MTQSICTVSMFRIAVAIFGLLSVSCLAGGRGGGEPPSKEFDCAARRLAAEFAAQKLSWSSEANLRHVSEALRLVECVTTEEELPVFTRLARRTQRSTKRITHKGNKEIFVDASKGNDDNDGSIHRPLRTLTAARDRVRASNARNNNNNTITILLRGGGRHYLEETLVLDDRDSGLVIEAYSQDDEKVILSGGTPLKLALRPTAQDNRIYSASLKGLKQNFDFTLLFKVKQEAENKQQQEEDDERLVWAREPNGHPERDLQPDGYALVAGGPGTARQWPTNAGSIHLAVTEPRRNSSVYPVFGEDLDPRGGGNWYHVGGTGTRFVNQRGFWNGSVSMGLQYNETTLNTSQWTADGYKHAVAHVFHNAFWGNWQYLLQSVNATQQQIDFSHGGWQEGRGGAMSRQPFYVEGVREALDEPGEWWLDRKEQVLYYYPHENETSIETDVVVVEFVAPRLKRLVAVMGSSETNPAVNISLRGLTFAHSATTFLDPYEVPSPGDWSIRRDGALFVENAEGLQVDLCRFVRTGGNAVFLSGHVKRSNLTRTEFAWTGDSAVVTVGRLNMADGFTVDSFPEDTRVAQNHFREVGVHGKQTSALFSALSCRTVFIGNVAYNGPRAGVNLNDHFCHGHRIEDNLLFNWVRETQDHGPINTWDRALYIQRDPVTGEPTTTPQWTHVTRNFIMNGPSGNRDLGNLFPTIDNDDGSSYFLISDNFLVYGGAKNYLGHDKIWAQNLIAYPGRWSGDPCAMIWAGKNHRFEGNTCIVGPKSSPIGLDGTTQGFECVINWDDPQNIDFVGRTANNSYFLHDVDSWGFSCGNGSASGHFFTMAEMQTHGWEWNSSVRDSRSLSAEAIIAMAREKLHLH